MLRFANQPNTTGTGRPTRDGHDSAGDAIRVEIYDPATNETVDTDADVTLTLGAGSARGKLIGGTAKAVAGVATFPDLSIDTPGLYTLKASSADDKDTPVSNGFMVADTVATCDGPGCSFTETQGAALLHGDSGARVGRRQMGLLRQPAGRADLGRFRAVRLPGRTAAERDLVQLRRRRRPVPKDDRDRHRQGDRRSDAGQRRIRISGLLFVAGALHRPHGRPGQAGSLG